METIRGAFFENSVSYDSPGCDAVGYAARKRGLVAKKFSQFQLHNLELSKDMIVKGQINNVRTALSMLGCEQPENIDIPDSLRSFAKRKIWKSTLGGIKDSRVFVKPLVNQKVFSGQIFHPGLVHNYGKDFPVLVQEVCQFNREFRVYVVRKEIVGVCKYKGWSLGDNVKRGELIKFAKEMIGRWKDAPASHTLDIGEMLVRGVFKEYALVEVNDGFSCGKYDGITRENYYRVVEARWKELVGL